MSVIALLEKAGRNRRRKVRHKSDRRSFPTLVVTCCAQAYQNEARRQTLTFGAGLHRTIRAEYCRFVFRCFRFEVSHKAIYICRTKRNGWPIISTRWPVSPRGRFDDQCDSTSQALDWITARPAVPRAQGEFSFRQVPRRKTAAAPTSLPC